MKFIIVNKKGDVRSIIILFFLYLSPIIDNILGGIINSTNKDSMLGKTFRLFFLLLLIMIYLSVRHLKKDFLSFICASLLAITYPIIYSIINSTTIGLATDYVQISKLFYPIILYLVCNDLMRFGVMSYEQLVKCLHYYVWFYPLSIVVPYILEIGYKSYRLYNVGYSGFYSFANELSIVLVVMYFISIFEFINKNRISMLIFAGMNIFCILLTGTKSGMILLVAGILIIILQTGDLRSKIFRLIKMILLISPIIFIIIVCIIPELNEIFNMILFRFEQLDKNFITFIFSSRNLKIIPNIKESFLENNFGMLNFLIGKGYYHMVEIGVKNAYVAEQGLIEMDLLDMIFQHGILVTAYVVWFYLDKLKVKHKNNNWIYKFGAITMMLYGILAGHMFQSTLPGTTMTLLLLLIPYNINVEQK